MTDLKPGWKRVKFGELANCINDRVDDPSKAGVERYVGLEHLDPDSLNIRRWGSPEDVESTKLRFRPGDIIFGKRRAYQRKLAVADFEGICSAHAMVLRAKPSVVLPEFLPYFMQSDLFMKRAVEISVGSLSPTINWKTLAQQEFALPPLEEQRRMTKLFDAGNDALNTMRQLEASARQVHYSTIDELTSHAIQTWPITSLDDLITPDRPITYGILMPGKGFPGGVPVIKVRDFPAGRISTADLLLTDPKIDHEYRRSRLRAGDLLVSIRGTIGRLTFVPEHLNGANITQDTARLSIRPEINPTYVRCLLESSWLRMQIRKNTTGLAVQGINIGEVRRLRVPVASESGQKKIAEAWEATSISVNAALDRSLAFQERFANLLNTVLSMP
ncbi:restriction endonuclease subunit S [Vulcanococcus limneticus]|uniref:restriction endonuclease subunit S n=1 Tax=Vulcanococcus limneticus TaxID=2170428 RepID=UPI00398C1727